MMKIRQSERLFDLVFVGMGCANSLLLLSLYRQNKLRGLNVAILEPDSKTRNDRTFCFWATDEEIHRYDLQDLISKSWTHCVSGNREAQSIAPYRYHHISGLALYEKTTGILSRITHTRISESVIGSVCENGFFTIQCQDSVVRAKKVFDSRPPEFIHPRGIETHLLQSFYGWKIETQKSVFNTDEFVMMDFSISQSGSTQFIYVLPYSENSALVECTRFGSQTVDVEEAETILAGYIHTKWGEYKITETETGVIPMCSAQIKGKPPGKNWIYTGGRAGNIKPSTGYSFLTSCVDAEKIALGIKPASKAGRYSFYDRLLLYILQNTPQNGKVIFERLFERVPAKTVLDFLREKVTVFSELSILWSLPKGIFIQTAFRDVLNRLFSIANMSFFAALLLILLQWCGLSVLGSGILLAGLLLLGLPHGAVDHLLETGQLNTPISAGFVIKYLLLAVAMGCFWWLSPILGLSAFLVYSAWHFGETEFQHGSKQSNLLAFMWGIFLLTFLLISHPAELNSILAEMGINGLAMPAENIVWVAFWGLLLLAWIRGTRTWLPTLSLLLLLKLPLLQAFGLYFVFDHSVKSSRQLLLGFQSDWRKLYLKAMPFTAGAVMLCLIFYTFNIWNTNGATGLFFIFLSCISFPHVLAMNGFYRAKWSEKNERASAFFQ